MLNSFRSFLLLKPAPAIWNIIIWAIASVSTLAAVYLLPDPGKFVLSSMYVAGIFLFCAWYQYSRIATLTGKPHAKSLVFTLLAVSAAALITTSSVLLAG